MVDYVTDAKVIILKPCKHMFHDECIQAWYDKHRTCPVDRLLLKPTLPDGNEQPGPSIEMNQIHQRPIDPEDDPIDE